MTAILTIDITGPDFSSCPFRVTGLDNSFLGGISVSFENATLPKRLKVVEADVPFKNNWLLPHLGVSEINGVLDLSDPKMGVYDSISIYANVENNGNIVQIIPIQISIPKNVTYIPGVSISAEPLFVNYGDPLKITVSSQPNRKFWIKLGSKTLLIDVNSSGVGSISVDSAEILQKSSVAQHLRISMSAYETSEWFDTNVELVIFSPHSFKTATTSTPLPVLSTIVPVDVDQLRYPLAGSPDLTSCTSVSQVTVTSVDPIDPDKTITQSKSFTRISGYSVSPIANGNALIAISSQQDTPDVAPTDDAELAMLRAHRIYVLSTSASVAYAGPVRMATVVDETPDEIRCGSDEYQAGVAMTIQVDEDIHSDPNLLYIWVINAGEKFQDVSRSDSNGDMVGMKFRIVHRGDFSTWVIVPSLENATAIADVGTCFTFVPYGGLACATPYPTHLSNVQPLPYIFDSNGLAVSSVNPQIATNSHAAPKADIYGYIVSEAVVDGASQLFYFSFNLNGSSFGWKQLTWTGENKNAKIALDAYNNLHIVWESSRCQTGQVYYGVLGPSSRTIMNETFASVLDKQAYLHAKIRQQSSLDETDVRDLPGDTYESLVSFNNTIPLNLGDYDNEYGTYGEHEEEYGEYYGLIRSMWTPFCSQDGISEISNISNLICTGNPSTDRFAAFACLDSTDRNTLLDNSFTQLSFQISFNLESGWTYPKLNRGEIFTKYQDWLGTFVPTSGHGVNTYQDSYGNNFTIGEVRFLYDTIIPIAGSYRAPGLCGDSSYAETYPLKQIKLRHFMLALVPERAYFFASNSETIESFEDRLGTSDGYEQYVDQNWYTGNFKLALVFETSANISDPRLAQQKNHVIRMIGEPLDITASHNFKIAVHYSKLRSETIEWRRNVDTVEQSEQSIRFTGNVIVAVDDIVQGAETFVPDFADDYYQFDIGLGCVITGEYYPNNIHPYEGTLNTNANVSLSYSKIAIGKHSVIPNSNVVFFGKSDRMVDSMYIADTVDETASLAAWQENEPSTSGNYLLSLGLHSANTRLSQIPITLEGRNTSPSLCVDKCGRVHIAYQSNRDNKWEIYYTSSLDASYPFRSDTRITKSPGHSLMPSIAIDAKGRRLIAWQDDRNGFYQIYIARSIEQLDCERGRCLREHLRATNYDDVPAFIPGEYGDEYSAYSSDKYAEICKLKFSVSNTSDIVKHYHFVANFYDDANLTSLYATVDSRQNIAGWMVGGEMMSYNGATVNPNESIEISYDTSREDDLSGRILYVDIRFDDDDIEYHSSNNVIVFYCPIEQISRNNCVVPCFYENAEEDDKHVHFRVNVYTDSGYSKLLLTADSRISQNRWVSGSDRFPPQGVVVKSGEAVKILYVPEFLPDEIASWQNAKTVTALLCNTNYFVQTEAFVDDVSQGSDTFEINCNCSDIDAPQWHHDNTQSQWLCSGQGRMDLRVTMTKNHTLFPSVAGSHDGMIYIVWEDHRLSTKNNIAPKAYYAVWDANTDALYSSAQGFVDTPIFNIASSQIAMKPLGFVNSLQHFTSFFSDNTTIFRKICSLYRSPVLTEDSESGVPNILTLMRNTHSLGYDATSAAQCFRIAVYGPDVKQIYHTGADSPLPMVDRCKVRFEIVGPSASYAVRFRNENESSFSAWIAIEPPPIDPDPYVENTTPIQTYLQAYFITNDRFVAQWILSQNSGNKKVYCEILTPFGISPVLSVDVLARYKELKYHVYFYKDDALTIKASEFNGYPVVSTNALTVEKGRVNTLTETIGDGIANKPSTYIKVVFDDPDYLEETLALTHLDKYNNDGVLTFDAVLPGKTIRNTLTPIATTDITFNYNTGAITDNIPRGSYKGCFNVGRDDGLDNIDGMSTIVVNIPGSCFASAADTPCSKKRKTIADVKVDRVNQVNQIKVNLERFREAYNPEIKCTFTSCFDGAEEEHIPVLLDPENPPEAATPVGDNCSRINWNVPSRGEPCFFVRQSENADKWVVYSPEFELNFSDPRIDYLAFGSDTDIDGVLIMIKPNETISVITNETVCPNMQDDRCDSNTYAELSRLVSFQLPYAPVVFYHNYVYKVRNYLSGPSGCNFPSAEKTFTIGTTEIINIPQGTVSNDGKDSDDGVANWHMDEALGRNYNPSETYITPGNNGLKSTFVTSVSKQELQDLGFVQANGILRFRFALIRSGIGYATIVNMTCGASCEE